MKCCKWTWFTWLLSILDSWKFPSQAAHDNPKFRKKNSLISKIFLHYGFILPMGSVLFKTFQSQVSLWTRQAILTHEFCIANSTHFMPFPVEEFLLHFIFFFFRSPFPYCMFTVCESFGISFLWLKELVRCWHYSFLWVANLVVLIKTCKDCCNILITASTCPLNPFTVEQSGFCYPDFWHYVHSSTLFLPHVEII